MNSLIDPNLPLLDNCVGVATVMIVLFVTVDSLLSMFT